MLNKIKKGIKNPRLILSTMMANGFIIFKILPDRYFSILEYWAYNGEILNLHNPKSFNEKIQWLKLNDRKEYYSKLVDKYLSKQIIGKVIGDEYIIPTIGVWDKVEDIKFEKLPEKFVLKCTHDSGGVIVCKDKGKIIDKNIRKKLKKYFRRKYYYIHREWPYKNIKPRIIAEVLLENSDNSELKDYKIMCFNGKAKLILVCDDRASSEGVKMDFYDENWTKLQIKRPNHPNIKNECTKPVNLEKMIEIAEKLSKNFKFIRVDFYEVNNKLYFGEITFYPTAGLEKFSPETWDYVLGEWIVL